MTIQLFRCWIGVILLTMVVAPAIPTSVAFAAGVVGNGTAASCTEGALDDALATGGAITFKCGGTRTIIFSRQKVIRVATTIDGGNLITLSGDDKVSLFKVAPNAKLSLDNVVLTNGRGVQFGGAIESFGTVVLRHTTVQNSALPEPKDCPKSDPEGEFGTCLGAGIASRAGRLELYNSRVIGNTGGTFGGGIASADLVDDEFFTGGQLIVRDSLVQGNRSGGNGGGISIDGIAEISSSVISDNEAEAAFGGGLAIFTGTLTLRDSVVERNHASRVGGGILISSAEEPVHTEVTISDTRISENSTGSHANDLGGGIYITGGAELALARSTVSDNTAGGGAGLFSYYPETRVRIDQSTFSGNVTAGDGGALWISSGAQALTNVTLSGNTAGRGGAIFVGTGTSIDVGAASGTLNHVTLAGNRATEGANVFHDNGALRLTNTIVAYPLGDTPNCVFSATTSALETGGYNIVDDDSCAVDNDGDRQDTDPRLAPLENNDGPTPTHLPLATSPAIDTGGGDCPPTDQRDLARPQGVACDSGAVEVVAAGVTCGGLVPVAVDTTITSAEPERAAGGDEFLSITRNAGGETRALLDFDLAGRFPPGSTVSRAILEVPLARSTTSVDDVLEVIELSAAWDEGVTWNTQPPERASYGMSVAGLAIPLVRIDVTTLVTRWATGSDAETSLSLVPGLPEMNLLLRSRESGDGPRLLITCAATPDAPAPADSGAMDAAQQAAIEELKATSTQPVSLMLDQGAVRSADFEIAVPATVADDGVAQAEWFVEEYSDLLRLDPAADLQLLRSSRDGRHIFFRQVHGEIPVYGAELGVHLDDAGNVYGLGGIYLPDLAQDAEPALDTAQAEALAMAAAPDGTAEVRGDTQLRYFNGRIVGLVEDRTVLVWRVNLRAKGGDVAMFVDANTGAIVFQESRVNEDFDLDLETGNFTGKSDTCWALTYDDDQWFDEDGPVSDDVDEEGKQAFKNITNVYNYWRGTFNRDSYDDDGEDIAMYIHVDPHPGTASYSSGCDIFEYSTGNSTLDIVGHEYTHAVDENEGGLIYSSQSGALDESYADIFAHAVDPGTWLIGDGSKVGTQRDMKNPNTFGDPDHMLAKISQDTIGLRTLPAGGVPICGGPPTVPNGNDCDSVHTNSGIHNKVAFLMTDGGTHNGYTIDGIGQAAAERLFWGVFTNCVWSSAQFMDARNCTVREAGVQAVGARGACAARNAFASVGLGSGDFDCDGMEDDSDRDSDNDGAPNTSDNCANTRNPTQADRDEDTVGNACDPDIDNDGICNTGGPSANLPGLRPGGCQPGALVSGQRVDNCSYDANLTQADGDLDGEGDACDDRDGDAWDDTEDNCPDEPNSQQSNNDGDLEGDVCDDDDDNDDVNDVGADGRPLDNCHFMANPDQADGDLDQVGNACDLCPDIFSNDNGDVDGDGRGNPCDPDADNDTICNIGGPLSGLPGLLAGGCTPGARLVRREGADNCPLAANTSQLDMDDDGQGLVCDQDEHERLLGQVQDYTDRFQFRGPITVPIGVCPQCGLDYLPPSYKSVIKLVIPPMIQARVIDSNGQTVAKPEMIGGIQQLQFEPRVFTGLALRVVGNAALAPQQRGATFEPAPGDIRYYLELIPGPDVTPGTVVDVEVVIRGGVLGNVYLPMVRR